MKKLTALIFLAVLFCAGQGWGATYYVVPSGAGTQDGLSWANAFALPSTAITAGNTDTGGDGPHIMYIAPGTYDDYISIVDDDWASGSIIGTVSASSTTEATKSQVLDGNGAIISNAANSPFTYNHIGATGLSVKKLAFTGTDATHYTFTVGAGSATVDDCYIYNSGSRLISSLGVGVFNRCAIKKSGNTTAAVTAGAGADLTFNVCLFAGLGASPLALNRGIYNYSTGSVVLNNCQVIDCTGRPIDMDAAGIVTVNNSIVGPSWTNGQYTLSRTAGTFNVNNSFIQQNYATSHVSTNGTITLTDCTTAGNPLFVSWKRRGIVSLNIDDYGNVDYSTDVAALLAQKGIEGTYFFDSLGFQTPATLTKITALHNGGVMEVLPHSQNHSDLSATTAWEVTKVGSTIDINRTTDTITVNPGAFALTPFKSVSLATIRTWLNGTAGVTNGGMTTNVKDTLMGESLDTVAAQDIAAGYTLPLLIDTTGASGFFKNEVADCLTDYLTYLSTTPTYFATPFGATSANLRTALASLGFEANRDVFAQATIAGYKLSSIALNQTMYIAIASYITDGGATDAQVAQRTKAIAEMAVSEGWFICLLAHNTGECTLAQWAIIIDTLKEYAGSLQILKYSDAIDYIQDSGLWATADNITYTRTWTDFDDFHLLAGSPCIDTGTYIAALAGTFDIYDKLFPAAADEFNIGASQQDPSSGKRYLVID